MRLMSVFLDYNTECINLEKYQVEFWMKHPGVAKGYISGQRDRIAVYTVQYQWHLKDMAAGFMVVKAQKFQS